jgi:transcriptional regulator with XRE-family HTH domain
MRGINEARRLAKELRKAAGLTQTELAEILGLKQPSISRIENERITECSMSNLEAILGHFDRVLTLEVTHEPPPPSARPRVRR